MADPKTEFEVAKDNFDTYQKGLGLVLVANAAGLVACLAALKDYQSTPMLKGIGIPIVFFGLGLLAGMLAYICLAGCRIAKTNESIGLVYMRKPHLWMFAYYGLQSTTLAFFSAGVWFCMWKFASL